MGAVHKDALMKLGRYKHWLKMRVEQIKMRYRTPGKGQEGFSQNILSVSQNIQTDRLGKWIFLVALFAGLYLLISSNHYTKEQYFVRIDTKVASDIFGSELFDQKTTDMLGELLIDTPNCKIPNLDRNIKANGIVIPITCDRYPPITYENGSRLEANWTAISSSFLNDTFSHCKYQAIYRPKHVENHDDFVFLEESQNFNSTIYIKDDFVRVKCYNHTLAEIYTNFHQFIHRKNEIEERCKKDFSKHVKSNKTSENMNILMIGVDSVSRLNFHRFLPKTKEFIFSKFRPIEMNGYNKVADNTFVNIVPLTTGKFVEELPWDESMSDIPFDNFTFIWDELAKHGYRTLLAEDAPYMANFDYLKAGFHTQPTDYFNRHFTVAMEDSNAWYRDHYCLTNRMETEIVLQYVLKFVSEFKSDPYFASSFITRLTHDYLENSALADIPYLNFFTSLYENKLIENTVVIFYSDHGIRFGEYRETFPGRLEERLPFMFIILPTWFLNKYPKIVSNLHKNYFRLSTPFDIYATLKNILMFDGKIKRVTKKMRNISLFSEIPLDRSCADAGILAHWCTCTEQEKLNTDDKLVLSLANYLIQEINKNISDHVDICNQLSLKEIDMAVRLISSNKSLSLSESNTDVTDSEADIGNITSSLVDYQLTVRATPGDGLFEATIRYDEVRQLHRIIGDISRINLYGEQSGCVEIHRLKKICFCK